MSDEPEDSGMSAMTIGMILGGMVVLVVIVVLAGSFFWSMERRVVIVENEARPPAIAPPGPGIKVANPRAHLIGFWVARTKEGVATMQFSDDGTLRMTDTRPGNADLAQPVVRWEIRSEKDGFMIKIDAVKGEPKEHVVRFLDDDRLIIETIEAVIDERNNPS